MLKKLEIYKNKHYPFPGFITPFPVVVDKHSPTYKGAAIMFSENCIYDFNDDDQLDINKLFGFSIGFHHKNSFRFGWRPNLISSEIDIFSYEYVNGVRESYPITNVKLNVWNSFFMYYCPSEKTISYVINNDVYKHNVDMSNYYGLGYTLGLYFGGNRKAPHKITVFKK